MCVAAGSGEVMDRRWSTGPSSLAGPVMYVTKPDVAEDVQVTVNRLPPTFYFFSFQYFRGNSSLFGTLGSSALQNGW
jgi:hypothetical protein